MDRPPEVADPYAEWLGVAPGPRPPDHYALLGLPRFVADAAAIHTAARRCLQEVRPRCLKYPELGTRLLNEIASAEVCLLDPARKAEYDRALEGPVEVVEVVEVVEAVSVRPRPAPGARPRALGGAAAALACLALAGWWLSRPQVVAVETDPPGAAVLLDGVPVGDAPVRVKARAGAELRAELEGYRPEAVRLTAASPRPVVLRLTALPAVFLLDVRPAAAEVIVTPPECLRARDGGRCRIEVADPAGTPLLTILVRRPTHHDERKDFVPRPGGTVSVAIVLESRAAAATKSGEALVQAKRPDEAIPELRKALKLDHDHAPAHLSLALALLAQGNAGEAEKHARLAIELGLKTAPAHAARAAALHRLGRGPEAREECERALKLPSPCAAARATLGALHLDRREYKQAVEECDLALKSTETDGAAYLTRATARRHLGQYEEALEDCKLALRWGADQARALAERAATFLAMKRPREAIRDCDAALRADRRLSAAYVIRAEARLALGGASDLDQALADCKDAPGDPLAHALRAEVYLRKGELDSAVSAAGQALKRDGNCGRAYAVRAQAHLAQDKTAEALDDCKQWIQRADQDARAYALRGKVRLLRKEYAEAVDDCTAALARDKNHVSALATRAEARYQLGDHGNAVEDASRWARLRPDDPEAFLTRGEACLRRRQWQQALDDAEQARRLNGKSVRATTLAGDACKQLNRLDDAVRHYQEAAKLEPNRADLHRSLGALHERLGRYREAVASWQKKALTIDPKDAFTHNSLAWLLATCPDGQVRNGSDAVYHAQTAFDLAERGSAAYYAYLNTLAAAHAEAGDFVKAKDCQRRVIDKGNLTEQQKAEAQHRLQLYKEGKPYHQPAAAPPLRR